MYEYLLVSASIIFASSSIVLRIFSIQVQLYDGSSSSSKYNYRLYDIPIGDTHIVAAAATDTRDTTASRCAVSMSW